MTARAAARGAPMEVGYLFRPGHSPHPNPVWLVCGVMLVRLLLAHSKTPISGGSVPGAPPGHYSPDQRLHSGHGILYGHSPRDTGVGMSPQPPQDGRWATFVPASYKNMALGEAQLP
jgi:hypothetical protein